MIFFKIDKDVVIVGHFAFVPMFIHDCLIIGKAGSMREQMPDGDVRVRKVGQIFFNALVIQ